MPTGIVTEISHPIGKNQTIQFKEIEKTLPLRVLSEADWQYWIKKGYIVVKNAVDTVNCQRIESAVWEFDE